MFAKSLISAAVAASLIAFLPGAAHAQGPTSRCSASALRVAAPLSGGAQPVAANPAGAPCVPAEVQLASLNPLGLVTTSAAAAATTSGPGEISARASIDNASLNLAGIAISAGEISSRQAANCVNGASLTSGSSRVANLQIGGTVVPVIDDQPLDLNVGVVRVRANQLAADGTRTALILDALGTEIVFAEAQASGDACQNAAGGPTDGTEPGPDGPGGGSAGPGEPGNTTPPPTPGTGAGSVPTVNAPRGVCPAGATFDQARAVCVIVESASGGLNGRQETIIVGAPSKAASGGKLLSLDEALMLVKQGKLPNSACLHGKGPRFVVLGSARTDKITGSNGPDRILTLAGNDDVAGGRGNDCIDGGGGRDILDGSAGSDRLYGGAGNDALNGGPSTDRINAGSGNDTVNTAFGRDRVLGGKGNDKINAATAGNPSRLLNCGPGRDTLRANRNERRSARHCEHIALIR